MNLSYLSRIWGCKERDVRLLELQCNWISYMDISTSKDESRRTSLNNSVPSRPQPSTHDHFFLCSTVVPLKMRRLQKDFNLTEYYCSSSLTHSFSLNITRYPGLWDECLFNEYFIFQLNGEAIKNASAKCCKIQVDMCVPPIQIRTRRGTMEQYLNYLHLSFTSRC